VPPLRHATATSAGGVVHRLTPDGHQVVVAHRRHPRLWALPKGTPEGGETLEETAERETLEETGLQVVVVAPLRAIRYQFVRGSTRFDKTVHFFLMRTVGGDVSAHDKEFDEVRWVPIGEALELLTHATERGVVELAAETLGAAGTGPAGEPVEVAG